MRIHADCGFAVVHSLFTLPTINVQNDADTRPWSTVILQIWNNTVKIWRSLMPEFPTRCRNTEFNWSQIVTFHQVASFLRKIFGSELHVNVMKRVMNAILSCYLTKVISYLVNKCCSHLGNFQLILVRSYLQLEENVLFLFLNSHYTWPYMNDALLWLIWRSNSEYCCLLTVTEITKQTVVTTSGLITYPLSRVTGDTKFSIFISM